MNELKEALHEAVFNGGTPAKVVAAEAGIKYNYLARMVLPGQSGCNFPAHLLAPVMRAAGNYAPLRVLAKDCGFLVVEPPPTLKPSSLKQALTPYLSSYSRSIEAILEALEAPGENAARVADALLRQHMEHTEKIRLLINEKEL